MNSGQENGSRGSRQPDWDLCIRRKGDSARWQKIGAGWSSERSGINIRLESKLTLELREVFGATWSVYLFPHRPTPRRKGHGREFGSWPKGDPRNVRADESMQEYFDRRRAEVMRGIDL